MSNFIKIRPVGVEFVPCGRTDGHEVKSRFSQFCERVWKGKQSNTVTQVVILAAISHSLEEESPI